MPPRSVSISRSSIEAALERALDPKARERVIVLREFFVEGKSQGEIHRLTNYPIPHIKYWLHKARRGGVEAVVGKRGWKPDGHNRNYQLSERHEKMLIERIANRAWESTASTQKFLLEQKDSSDKVLSAEAVRTYKSRLKSRALFATPGAKDTMDTLSSSSSPEIWNLIFRASIAGCRTSRLKLQEEASKQGLATKGWSGRWRAWIARYPKSEDIVEHCRRQLGDIATENLLKDIRIAKFSWSSNDSQIDGDHKFVWKLLGFCTNRKRTHIAFVRKNNFPRGGVFYRSGHFVFLSKPKVKKIPLTDFIERIVATFRRNTTRRSKIRSTPSPHEEFVLVSSHESELFPVINRYLYVRCHQWPPEVCDILRNVLGWNG